jgi:ribosomal protein S18 acetylase RimI-like enzyme
MISIRTIRQNEVKDVKNLICAVAYNIFGFDGSLEESIRHYESQGVFQDLEDVVANYFANGGTFLVAVGQAEIIGSGAILRIDASTAELKRMWLLEKFHGQGIGYRLMTELLSFAHGKGYSHIRLQTSPQQTRALAFYHKVGFYEIPDYAGDPNEISMELLLQGDY